MTDPATALICLFATFAVVWIVASKKTRDSDAWLIFAFFLALLVCAAWVVKQSEEQTRQPPPLHRRP